MLKQEQGKIKQDLGKKIIRQKLKMIFDKQIKRIKK